MTLLKIAGIIAAVLFFLCVFIGFVRWAVREWKKIEQEEEELRRQSCPSLRARGGN